MLALPLSTIIFCWRQLDLRGVIRQDSARMNSISKAASALGRLGAKAAYKVGAQRKGAYASWEPEARAKRLANGRKRTKSKANANGSIHKAV